ncbi:cysteine-rich CWC family protein [Azovibrio restrictus]|uniref:cysteine-rich CWC family protein n=1 Tax=Azovibrio restrictus TaxID=146938 RepID=UPI00350E4112
MLVRGSRQKACACCGRFFSCGAEQGGCWCLELPPVPQRLPYGDCLCPNCLAARVSASAEAPGQVQDGVAVAPGKAAPGGFRQV